MWLSNGISSKRFVLDLDTLSMFRQKKQWETLKPRGQASFS